MDVYATLITEDMKNDNMCPISYNELKIESVKDIRDLICIPSGDIPRFYDIESAYEYFVNTKAINPFTRKPVPEYIINKIKLFFAAKTIVKNLNITVDIAYINNLFVKWIGSTISDAEKTVLRAYCDVDDLDAIFHEFVSIDSMSKRQCAENLVKNKQPCWIIRTGSIISNDKRKARVLTIYKDDEVVHNLIIKVAYQAYYIIDNENRGIDINSINVTNYPAYICYLDILEQILGNDKSKIYKSGEQS